ncbi:ATP synthase F1 subunit gamma [Alistipes sp.]|uniref:ATP synthase F1 subunit gamma n=1 Tax=Alistipes sp. TaxID=1872444 RepID=UPI0025C724CB|nr:ATP synthase F1 subunit gamma [Alistipes sp.]MCI7139584.1 ATP synthase F1 subunit gamma [Alistipes sp.]MDY5396531.1 ATP synthase F1 subunit gamma [Alistipes sp.]
MASLKEIKARIASVQSTLKITSAMKMVASAKLHKVQGVAEALAEYERHLADIAAAICRNSDAEVSSPLAVGHERCRRAVVVAFSSDNSLCGAFNANVIREMTREVGALRSEGLSVEVWPVGEKIAQAAIKAEYPVKTDFRRRGGMPTYDDAVELARQLMERYLSGKVDRVVLVYNHFHSTGHQAPRSEVFLPADFSSLGSSEGAASMPADYIYEPDAGHLLASLIPYTVRIRMYEVLLDSATAEHAARMVAMQTATDNAQELLGDLTLSYNKRRQQAITDELADITQAG